MRSQVERDEQTLDIAAVVLAVAAWLVVVAMAAVAGAVLDDLDSRFRVMPIVAFFGFWPAVIVWRVVARRRRESPLTR